MWEDDVGPLKTKGKGKRRSVSFDKLHIIADKVFAATFEGECYLFTNDVGMRAIRMIDPCFVNLSENGIEWLVPHSQVFLFSTSEQPTYDTCK
jgi:hypothetical protein